MNVLLCPLSDGGYLYPAVAVGRELARRGHVVGAVGRARSGPVLSEAGLPFVSAEELGGPAGFSAARWAPTGVEQLRTTMRAAAALRADVLVTSMLCHGALLAAEVLDLPVIVIGLATHLWDYRAGGAAEPLRAVREGRTRDIARHHATLREHAGLRPRRYAEPQEPLLGSALLLRGAPALEFPGAVLPRGVHHVGPLPWEPAAEPGELAELRAELERRAKPLVYVHLGRTFGGTDLWPILNAAFTDGPLQAVVERGRTRDPRPAPGADITLVHRPWMDPLLDLARLVLTNATSAPVLAALLRGRPVCVAPNGAEQPFVAAACLRAGVAELMADRDSGALLSSIGHDDQLRARARALGRDLAGSGGAVRAADVVEGVADAGTAAAAGEG